MSDETKAESGAAPDILRAGEEQDAGGSGAPVAASDPRSLTVDRGATQSASPGVDDDRAAAERAG